MTLHEDAQQQLIHLLHTNNQEQSFDLYEHPQWAPVLCSGQTLGFVNVCMCVGEGLQFSLFCPQDICDVKTWK